MLLESVCKEASSIEQADLPNHKNSYIVHYEVTFMLFSRKKRCIINIYYAVKIQTTLQFFLFLL